ncbi:1-phosphatidylinositol 4,5-bisphosphate phosphodiesterase gamma-1 [Schistocerca americana]|uniref:1-phosphatidylinositol 4,5-bisphosphate phosphodiesterase gamma-1 n=1 Tax=Schistocerca americana TaxID=7009 RepID=UPI001F4FD41E|nr:1-phosphatidylinositol 4,5-bisphosphate phosphodiesterase gamma-1 [Schistocerca americana]XP_049960027.1 1-phosphatidylinositol 4,5-bisphosphate phosphodiesterase gamma-1 [Schistocerca serialis cubense]XP_049960028.1 1-phosphatidylinositol 4,5-bisphosphate phosphodiesterase gamma-1 [Schistocerca serialis cubense]
MALLGMPNGTPLGSMITETEQIISQLERGTVVTKFFQRKRPERKTLMLRRETRQLVWARTTNIRTFEVAVDLREVKEVRIGKNSKDFEKWPEEAKRMENLKCFVIYYGLEFRLKTLSIAAFSESECTLWIRGLDYLVNDTIRSPYPLQVERWLRKEFYKMESGRETVTLKDLKAFLPRVNCKIPTNKLRDVFQEVDTRKRMELGFDDFATLYQKLMFDNNMYSESFSKLFSDYSENGKTVTLQEFQSFLSQEQRDPMGDDEREVSSFMRNYLQDSQRNVQEPYFTIFEFMDFLFSKQNEIWDERYDKVYQDMTKPLSHYWIASSHNTYLTGDQFSSESSTEAYVRCLRMGCRCIELDCWDGPDGMPFIYHGHTLTTRIKFLDVVKTIKEHAFVTSEYPLILSIEDNCSVPQQRKMAKVMLEVFGEMLLVQLYEKNESQLPSPHQLRRKIIIKHKKLPDGVDEDAFMSKNDDARDVDLRNTVKNGILYLEDPVDKEWNKHFFVLTKNKLFYTDSFHDEQEGEGEEEEEESGFHRPKEGIPNDDLHFSEKWFHGKLASGRTEAETLLKDYSHLGDGTFLVRESETFVGDYSLSFWRQGKVNHCHIRSKQENNQTKYYLIDTNCFDSLYSLITHYQSHPLRSQEFLIKLQKPVPQPNKHEGKEWYYPQATKLKAEELLKRVPADGAFLVRPSESDTDAYAISFRAEKKIKHCRIKLEGRLYTIGTFQFESLVELVSYYERHPLYHRTKLRYPVTEESISRMAHNPDDCSVYGTPGYMDPSSFTSRITVKALYDYQARNDDELSFCKHAVITNVNKQGNSGWWRGDYGGKKQHWFPSNYVEEWDSQENRDDNSSDSLLLGSLQKGSLDVMGAIVEVHRNDRPGLEWVLRIQNPNMCSVFEVAVPRIELAVEWRNAIKEVAQNASVRENQHKEMEKQLRIAKEMSDLIVYCRSVAFNMEKFRRGFNHCEMSSFPETKAEKLICQQETKFFLKYHQHQFSRIYPKGQRIDSSNYIPVPMWNAGSQMVALNYQTPDKAMQLNQGKFRQNGFCGYLLRPDFMFLEDFDPYDKKTLVGVDPLNISVRVICARHLSKWGKGRARGTVSPFVEIEVIGADFDNKSRNTQPVSDNGFNPVWNETFDFEVSNPHFALLRFVVQDEDMFGDSNFIGQATYPVLCLRTGYRSVPLKNGYSEDLELASLLVHISITNPMESREVLPSTAFSCVTAVGDSED